MVMQMNQAEYEARYADYEKELYQIADSITPCEYEALELLSIQLINKQVIIGTYQIPDQNAKLFLCEDTENGKRLLIGLSLTEHRIDSKVYESFISEGMIYQESCFTAREKAQAIEQFFVVGYDYVPSMLEKIKGQIDARLRQYQDLWK